MYVWCLRVFDAAPFTSETMTPRSACFTGFASSCLVNRFAWMAGVLHLNQSWCSMLTAETLFNQQALPWETICLNEMWIRMIWKSWTLIMLVVWKCPVHHIAPVVLLSFSGIATCQCSFPCSSRIKEFFKEAAKVNVHRLQHWFCADHDKEMLYL